MTDTIYIQLHIGDFVGDTLDMDCTEIGAYFLLLMAHYKNGLKGIPADESKLRRIARVDDRRVWARIKDAVLSRFEEHDGWLKHARVVAELEKRTTSRAKSVHKTVVATDDFENESVRKSDDKPLENKETVPHNLNPITNNQKEEREERTSSAPPVGDAARPDEAEAKGQEWVAPDTTAASVPAEPLTKPKAERGLRLKAFLEREGEDDAAQEWGTWALSQGLTASEINAEMQKFCDYWNAQPGQKGVKLDWPATWRNWVRRVVETKQREEERRAIYRR